MTQVTVYKTQLDVNTQESTLTPPSFDASTYKSPWIDMKDYRRLIGTLSMNQASATNGVVIEWSNSANPTADSDADDWDAFTTVNKTHPVTAITKHAASFSIEVVARYYRIVVKHGASAPTAFKLVVVGVGIT